MDRDNPVLCLAACLAGLLGALAPRAAHSADEAGRGPLWAASPVYVRKAGLTETLLATRAAWAATQAAQAEARTAVQLGPWHVAAGPVADEALRQPIDLGAKGPDGAPCWTAKPEWKDAALFDLPGGTVVLCRAVRASKAVALAVGLGGGDRLEMFLNGRPVLAADTAISFGRYGTGQNLDGTRVDQVGSRLELAAGENRLVVKITQKSPGPRQAYFSAAPDLVPFLWRQVENDFPRSRYRLLAQAPAEWFQSQGWMARSDARLEGSLLDGIVRGLGDRAAAVRQGLESLQREKMPGDDRQWLDLCVTAAELQSALDDIGRTRAAVASLAETYRDRYPGEQYLTRLGEIESRLVARSARSLDPRHAEVRQLVAEIDACRREMLVAANPLLRGQKVLFVRRWTYDSQHFYDDYYNGVRKYGGSLCELSIDGRAVRDVTPRLAGGVFDRFDLSYDARRVVFGYRPPRPEGFRIWEVSVDGTGLRQLTFEPEDEAERMARYSLYPPDALEANPILHGHWTDDMHPCYLPGGQIALASSRCERTAVCGGHTLPCTVLYKMNADGSRLERLSQGMLSEFAPTVLDDGRILYTRWEYVFKGIAAIQPLWAMRPDGSCAEEVYGDNIRDPGVFYQARQVPGRPDLIVATGCGHEPLSVGAVLLVDRRKDKRTAGAMTSLTPDTEVRDLRGLCQRRNGAWRKDDLYGPFYCDPYPLSDKFFLVSCNPDRRYNDESAYGIYLLDAFGNRVPVYADPEMSCFQPVLLAPRPEPPVLAPVSDPGAVAASPRQSPSNQSAAAEGTLVVADVYRGLPGVRPGEVKYLRVFRQVPRPWSVWPNASGDAWPGQMVAVSWFSHIWIAVLEGVVPVEADGSAHFTVPADADVYFQALDKDFMEIQRMRTFINLRPGERRSCIGCHERRAEAPGANRGDMPLALRRGPDRPGPQPGETAPRVLDYAADVQPVLDRHCVSCHGRDQPAGGLALCGDPSSHFSRSYEEIMRKELVSVVCEWAPPPGKGSSWHWSMEHAPVIPPYRYGSHASRLVQVLRQGHYDVDLAQADFVRLATWADSNGQFYGSYFGLRNLNHKDQKDFRPHPTLASACGLRPDLLRPKPEPPVPAELIASWTFDEGQGDAAGDASGKARAAKVVGAQWTEGKRGRALRFSGNADYVAAGDFDGTFDTLSIALWVKAESVRNHWNPLLFCDTWSDQDLHLSLLETGQVNVAIHNGSAGGYHRASHARAGDGVWRHVALVCDQRAGGGLAMYIDGKRDRTHPLFGPPMPVRLSGVRLGGYNVWEKAPGANFHGSLDEVRIYRGMLTAGQVAALAGRESPGR